MSIPLPFAHAMLCIMQTGKDMEEITNWVFRTYGKLDYPSSMEAWQQHQDEIQQAKDNQSKAQQLPEAKSSLLADSSSDQLTGCVAGAGAGRATVGAPTAGQQQAVLAAVGSLQRPHELPALVLGGVAMSPTQQAAACDQGAESVTRAANVVHLAPPASVATAAAFLATETELAATADGAAIAGGDLGTSSGDVAVQVQLLLQQYQAQQQQMMAGLLSQLAHLLPLQHSKQH